MYLCMPSPFEQQKDLQFQHHYEHILKVTPTYRDNSCYICYPPLRRQRVSDSFWNFWNWLSDYHYAVSHSAYTSTAFSLFIHQLEHNPPDGNYLTTELTDLAYKTLLSLCYIYLPSEETFIY